MGVTFSEPLEKLCLGVFVGDDGRTYVDGVDLADIADPDVAPPLHEAWQPVAAPRRRGRRGGDDGRAGA